MRTDLWLYSFVSLSVSTINNRAAFLAGLQEKAAKPNLSAASLNRTVASFSSRDHPQYGLCLHVNYHVASSQKCSCLCLLWSQMPYINISKNDLVKTFGLWFIGKWVQCSFNKRGCSVSGTHFFLNALQWHHGCVTGGMTPQSSILN